MSGWPASSAPTSPAPCTTLTTPGGKPASAMHSASSWTAPGVYSDGLIDHRAARAERAAELPAHQLDRVVPRRDRGDRPDGLLAHDREVVVALVGDRLAADPLRLLGVEAHRLGELADLATRLVERLAHLPRHRSGEVVEPVERHPGELAQQVAALEAGRGAPGPERGDGGGHRRVDGVGIGHVRHRDELARGGIAPLELLATGTELAADERPAVQQSGHGVTSQRSGSPASARRPSSTASRWSRSIDSVE